MFSQLDKQVARAWYGYTVEPHYRKLTRRPSRATGPRIAVVGNCQAFGIAYAMKLLDPTATVQHFSAIGRSKTNMRLFGRIMDSFDYVFSHEFAPGHIQDGASEELCARVPKTVLFPAITFPAFHPDLVYLLDETRNYEQLHGPLGAYQSALAVFAFRKGLSLEEANALYNRNVFEAVGYLDIWNDAATELLTYVKSKFQMDLEAELLSWSRRGVFMYSLVHPKSFVLFDIAKKLFAQQGLPVRDLDFDYVTIHDLSRSEIFPVYPPIGDLFGVRGSYLFKLGHYHLSYGVGDFMNLPQYLTSSYKIYERAQESQIKHARIDKWLSDPAISERLVSLARENLRTGLKPVL
jgi:hypothetical protein